MNWAAKDRSEIALNTIWSEHVEKESKILKRSIKTTYTCNPCASISMNNGLGMRMASVTEKVGYSVGLEPVEIGEDPDVKAVVSGLLGAQKVPTEKYSEPITSAQEVGWYSKPLVAANPRFVHGLKQAEATEVRSRPQPPAAAQHTKNARLLYTHVHVHMQHAYAHLSRVPTFFAPHSSLCSLKI